MVKGQATDQGDSEISVSVMLFVHEACSYRWTAVIWSSLQAPQRPIVPALPTIPVLLLPHLRRPLWWFK